MNWTFEELAEVMAKNPQLRISQNPLTDKPIKRSKYGNKRTEVDGITFDSAKEAARYKELKILERAGAVKNLTLQPKYSIIVNDMKICDYVADFTYQTRLGETKVEDVKGMKTPAYRLKKKLMKAVFNIEILES